jgi:geranylgeranyl pyrophosphate synthase
LGTDLASGQLTLPLLYLRDSAGPETRERLSHCFNGNGASAAQKAESLKLLKEEAIKAQVPAYCQSVARRYLARARAALASFPASPCKTSLAALTDYLLQ